REPGLAPGAPDLPGAATVGDARRVRLLLERGEEDERADDERGPEDPAADVPRPELLAGRGVVGTGLPVEVAEEDASVRDRRRRIAGGAEVVCPERLAVRGAQRDDEPGARDREQAQPVGRSARVEACVAQEVTLDVADPEELSVPPVEAEDRPGVSRDADPPAEHRRARVDPAAGLVRPADPPADGVDREQATVRGAEIRRLADHDRRRLDLRGDAQLPEGV